MPKLKMFPSYLCFSLTCPTDLNLSHYTELEDTINSPLGPGEDVIKPNEQVKSVFAMRHQVPSHIGYSIGLGATKTAVILCSGGCRSTRRATLPEQHTGLTERQSVRAMKVQYMFQKNEVKRDEDLAF